MDGFSDTNLYLTCPDQIFIDSVSVYRLHHYDKNDKNIENLVVF